MTNANIKPFAEELSDLLMKAADLKIEMDAVVNAAKEAGICPKSLRKVAKEMITEPEKLRQKYADEEQLDMFRAQVGIFKRKGLEQPFAEAAE